MADKITDFIKNKTILSPICDCRYKYFMSDKEYAKSIINDFFKNYPELFCKEHPNLTYIFHASLKIRDWALTK